MRALINAFFIHITLNLLVFLKGWHSFEGKKVARLLLTVLLVVELLLFGGGFFFYRYLPEPMVQHLRVLGTSWMLFLLYSGGIWLVVDLSTLIMLRQMHRPFAFLRSTPLTYRVTTFIIPIIFVMGLMLHGRYRFMNPTVRQIPIRVYKNAGKYDSLRVVVAGDLHLGWMIDRNHTRRFVDLIMEQEADISLFVGDLIDSYIEPVLQQRLDSELQRLSAPLGVYSCTGNHEYRSESEQKIALLNNAGITMLRDTALLIDSAFYVAGREDRIFKGRKRTKEILHNSGVHPAAPVILLNHVPDNLEEEVEAGADVALFGHTHLGQVFPGNLITRSIFEVAHGYKKKGNTHIYVTSGLGLVGPQYRIGTRSEVVVMTIYFNEQGL